MFDAQQARKLCEEYWSGEAKERRRREKLEKDLNEILAQIKGQATNGESKIVLYKETPQEILQSLQELGFQTECKKGMHIHENVWGERSESYGPMTIISW